MRFGVCAPNISPPGDEYPIIQIADAAERLGYHSVWVSDHIVLPTAERRFGHAVESFVALSFMAARTARIKLGTSVLVLPQRAPLLVAKQAASLHHLSGGRLVLGVGAGWLEEEFDALGYDFATRGRRTDEYLEVLRAAWSQGVAAFDGVEIKFSDIISAPRPDPANPIPVLVGGNSPAALRRAARYADGWQAEGVTPAELRVHIERLVELTGGRPLDISARIATGVGRKYEQPQGPIVRQYARIEGTLQQVAEAVAAYAEAGLNELVLQLHGEDYLEQLQAFAEEVMPAVSDAP